MLLQFLAPTFPVVIEIFQEKYLSYHVIVGPTTANIWNVYFPFHCYFFRAFCLAIELIHYVYLFAICKQFVAYQQHLNDDKNKNVLDYFRYYLSVIKYVYRVRRCTKGKIKRIRYIFFTNLIYIFKCVTHTL